MFKNQRIVNLRGKYFYMLQIICYKVLQHCRSHSQSQSQKAFGRDIVDNNSIGDGVQQRKGLKIEVKIAMS